MHPPSFKESIDITFIEIDRVVFEISCRKQLAFITVKRLRSFARNFYCDTFSSSIDVYTSKSFVHFIFHIINVEYLKLQILKFKVQRLLSRES
jgi:hypothetical protein